jgi:hypothetical protein
VARVGLLRRGRRGGGGGNKIVKWKCKVKQDFVLYEM